MNAALKIFRKIARLPFWISEELNILRQKEGCTMGSGAKLYPSTRIGNIQSNPSLITIGKQSHVLGQLYIQAHGGAIHIGDSCFIGEGSRIWSANTITLGDRVLISHNVNIHDFNSHSLSAHERHLHVNAIFSTGHPKVLENVASAPIVIEDDVWIGFNATILKGVTIGKGAIVAAGSVVTKSVEPYTVVVGNPARVVGNSKP